MFFKEQFMCLSILLTLGGVEKSGTGVLSTADRPWRYICMPDQAHQGLLNTSLVEKDAVCSEKNSHIQITPAAKW